MLVPLTRKGRSDLARAVEELLRDPQPERARQLFARLPEADQLRLLKADPADVFVTAVRAWRLERPGLKRNLQAGLLVLQSRAVTPTIAQAQEQLREARA